VPCHLDYEVEECNDDSNGDLSSRLTFSCAEGLPLTIAVDAFDSGQGVYRLSIASTQQAPSTDLDVCPVDDLGSALASSLATGTVRGRRFGTGSGGSGGDFGTGGGFGGDDETCYGGSPRLGFTWTAPHTGTFRFDTFGSNYDTVLVLRTECFGDVLTCNDDSGDDSGGELQSSVVADLTDGSRIVVEIAAYGGNVYGDGNGRGTYVLNISAL
jgi:hypothetical protein